MLSKKLQNEIIKIDLLITPIQCNVNNRFRFYVLPQNNAVIIRLINKTKQEMVFSDTIPTSEAEYIEFIDILRDNFIKYGTLVSKLNRSNDSNVTYSSQELYFSNVSMSIQINNKTEELEALRAHAEVLRPKSTQIQKKKSCLTY